jgi:hypothetical protein
VRVASMAHAWWKRAAQNTDLLVFVEQLTGFWPFQPASRASGRSAEKAMEGTFVTRTANGRRASVNRVGSDDRIVISRRAISRTVRLCKTKFVRPSARRCKRQHRDCRAGNVLVKSRREA